MSPVRRRHPRLTSRARSLAGALLLSAAAAAAVLPAGGCKKDYPTNEQMNEEKRQAMAPVLARHKDAAAARLAAIKAVAADAAAAAPVTAREPKSADLVAVPDFGETEPAGLLLAGVEVLAMDGKSDAAKVPLDPDLYLPDFPRVMADGYLPSWTAEGFEPKFVTLENLKQVAAVRVREYRAPKVTSASGETRFTGARAGGDVIVYDLATGKRVGAFPFEAAQRDTVTVRSKDGAGAERELEQAFAIDLKSAVRKEYAAYAAGKAGLGSAADVSRQQFETRIRSKLLESQIIVIPQKVQLSYGADGKPVVTIWTDTTLRRIKVDEPASAEVTGIVTKVLGRDADVRLRPAEKPATGAATKPA
ncbi:MAG TPA: hypothetical protein VF796_21445 [Humisphaera sp.]